MIINLNSFNLLSLWVLLQQQKETNILPITYVVMKNSLVHFVVVKQPIMSSLIRKVSLASNTCCTDIYSVLCSDKNINEITFSASLWNPHPYLFPSVVLHKSFYSSCILPIWYKGLTFLSVLFVIIILNYLCLCQGWSDLLLEARIPKSLIAQYFLNIMKKYTWDGWAKATNIVSSGLTLLWIRAYNFC